MSTISNRGKSLMRSDPGKVGRHQAITAVPSIISGRHQATIDRHGTRLSSEMESKVHRFSL